MHIEQSHSLIVEARFHPTILNIDCLPGLNGLFIFFPSDMWIWISSYNTDKGSNATRFHSLAYKSLFNHRRTYKRKTKTFKIVHRGGPKLNRVHIGNPNRDTPDALLLAIKNSLNQPKYKKGKITMFYSTWTAEFVTSI